MVLNVIHETRSRQLQVLGGRCFRARGEVFVVAIGSSRRGGTPEGDLKKGWFRESNEFEALTDGLLRIRYLFGFDLSPIS